MTSPQAVSSLIGVDIGGTKIALVKAKPDGTIVAQQVFATEACAPTLERILTTVATLDPGPNPAFGVACGSPQDSRQGLILSPPNLPGWDCVPITRLLTERFGGHAWLMNDANACALAEWTQGAGRGARHMLFMTFGTGLGAGLILDGKLYEGASGDAGELGHIRLAEQGPLGYGKHGSFEGFCSGGGIARFAQLPAMERDIEIPRHPDSAPDAPLSTRDVAYAAGRGNRLALEAMQESGRRLGQGLAIVVDLLNPECIVIGGIYTRCRHLLEPAMREVLEREALPHNLHACRIVPAELGEAIGPTSAIAIARYHLNERGAD